MILTVSGWRDWKDPEFVLAHFLPYVNDYQFTLYVRVGDAPGVDQVIRDWLVQHSVPWIRYKADWDAYGKGAGPIRNGEMLRGEGLHDLHPNTITDRLLAFPQPGINWKTDKSGTVDCILQAAGLGVHVDVPGYKI